MKHKFVPDIILTPCPLIFPTCLCHVFKLRVMWIVAVFLKERLSKLWSINLTSKQFICCCRSMQSHSRHKKMHVTAIEVMVALNRSSFSWMYCQDNLTKNKSFLLIFFLKTPNIFHTLVSWFFRWPLFEPSFNYYSLCQQLLMKNFSWCSQHRLAIRNMSSFRF